MSETEYTSIRVKKETKEQAAKSKSDRETWDDFILRCVNEPVAIMSQEDIESISEHIAAMKIRSMVVDDALL